MKIALRSACLLSLAASVSAEEAPKASEASEASETPIYELPAYTVQGEKFTRPLQETLSSVGLVEESLIEDSAVLDLNEVFRFLANVNDADFIDSGIIIRGINSEGVGGPAGGPLATLYVDGIPQTRNGARRGSLGVWDVEQIEVLRGPQSTLSGRNALAGAIRVETNDPTFDWESAVKGGVGNDEFYETGVMVSGPLSDVLAFRLTGELIHREGEVDYPFYDGFPRLDERKDDDAHQFRGKLLYAPKGDDGIQVLLSLSHAYDSPAYQDVDGPSAGVDYEDREWGHQSVPVFVEARSTETDQASLDVTVPLDGFWTLESLSGYLNTRTERPSVDLESDGEIDETDLTQELRLLYGGEDLETVLGVFLLDREFDDDRDQKRPWESFLRRDRRDGEIENYAVFGEARWNVAGPWTLIGGARYDYEEQSFSNLSQRIDGGTTTTVASGRTEADFDAFLPKAGVAYALSPDDQLSFVVQRAYRAGGSGVNGVTGQSYTYDPEYAWNYEFAFKGRAFDDRLAYALNIFYLDWRDQQINVPQIPGDFTSDIILNAGESKVYGGELELRSTPSEGLELFASLGLSKTEFEDFSFVQFGSLLDLSGKSFPQAPEYSAAIGGQYTFDNGFFVGGDVKHTGSAISRSIIEGLPKDELDSYTIGNVRAGWGNERWKVTLWADNVTDEDYFLYRYDTPGFQVATLGGGRTYGIQVRWNY